MTDEERKKAIMNAKVSLMKLQEEFQKRKDRIGMTIERLVKSCRHTKTNRTSDPSGGNDHAYECLVCGKNW
jgi:hypothetical protein